MMRIADAMKRGEEKQEIENADPGKRTHTVRMSHEDMVFLRALVHPQPSRKEYEDIIDRYAVSLWESEFDDGFSIGAYESDMVSCVLTYVEGSDYCDVLRLQVREKETNVEHCILWDEVDFIEKTDDTIIVTGCRMYEMVDDEPQLVLYDLSIVEKEVNQ